MTWQVKIMSDIKIPREDWFLLAYLLFSENPVKQKTAFNLLQTEYADKAKRLELKELYKTNFDEYCRVQKMSEAEYIDRLHKKYSC